MSVADPFDQLTNEINAIMAENPLPPEAQKVTLRELLLKLRERQALGHGTCPWSNPIQLVLGWKDLLTGEIFCSKLTTVKQGIYEGAETFEGTGISSEEFKKNIGSTEGQERMYGFPGSDSESQE
jgi:hypothetical protein